MRGSGIMRSPLSESATIQVLKTGHWVAPVQLSDGFGDRKGLKQAQHQCPLRRCVEPVES